MPVFGDKECIAVEFELNEEYGGTWLFGKFCYWICGVQIGDYDLGTSLNISFSGLARIVKDNGKREAACLFDLSTRDLFVRLQAGLLETDAAIAEIAMREQWARFSLTPVADVFDRWRVYLVERGEEARLIVEQPSSNELLEFRVPAGSFDSPSREAFDVLDELWEIEMSKTHGHDTK